MYVKMVVSMPAAGACTGAEGRERRDPLTVRRQQGMQGCVHRAGCSRITTQTPQPPAPSTDGAACNMCDLCSGAPSVVLPNTHVTSSLLMLLPCSMSLCL